MVVLTGAREVAVGLSRADFGPIVRAQCVSSKVERTKSTILFLLQTYSDEYVWEYEIVDWPAGGRINPRPGQSGLARLDPLAA